jgi:hypothetical protein
MNAAIGEPENPVTFLSKTILELAHGPRPFWDRENARVAISGLLRLIATREAGRIPEDDPRSRVVSATERPRQ